MGLSNDNSMRSAAAGDQPSATTSSTAAGEFSAGSGISGVAGGAAPGSKRGKGMGVGDLSLLPRLFWWELV